MNADSFEPTPESNAFMWSVLHSHPNQQVAIGDFDGSRRPGLAMTTAGGLGRDWRQLLDHLRTVEAERDKWQALALKLADAFGADKQPGDAT